MQLKIKNRFLLKNKMGSVIWFTGLSGSGKTTIALELKKKLESAGKKVEIIDGDTIRNTLHKHLGFSREDIKENNKLIAELAFKEAADFTLVPIISPYEEDREMARSIIGSNFFELFINASLDECMKRDVKGMYKKALAGDIPDFIGVADSNPYQAPENPDIEVNTAELDIEQSVNTVIESLRNKDLL